MKFMKSDVWDTLELAALSVGGVGAGTDFYTLLPYGIGVEPCCLYGLAQFAESMDPKHIQVHTSEAGPVVRELWRLGIDRRQSDVAVHDIRYPKAHHPERVNFHKLMKILKIQRGVR